MGATGLGKGSLYAAFGDKHGLYLRVRGDYARRSVTRGVEALGHAGVPEASLVRTVEAAIAGLPRPARS